jgi:hypothetical protein
LTGLATDGTTYFYQVTAVNGAGESGPTSEVSATPFAPDGLLFSDDFSTGPSDAWTFSPSDHYWQPQVGLPTDAGGDTVANVPQTATFTLPTGANSWQADLKTLQGHGAGVDTQGNPGNTGIAVVSADGNNAVYFSIFDNNALKVGTTVNGVFQGWTQVGTAPTASHPGGPEELWHTYQINLNSDSTFSVVFDGNVLKSGISAGSADAWADGIGSGTLFTQSSLDNRHLSTTFDNVRAWGSVAGPSTSVTAGHHTLPSATSGNQALIITSITSGTLATSGLSTSTAVASAAESGPSNDAFATAPASLRLHGAPTNAGSIGAVAAGLRAGGDLDVLGAINIADRLLSDQVART